MSAASIQRKTVDLGERASIDVLEAVIRSL